LSFVSLGLSKITDKLAKFRSSSTSAQVCFYKSLEPDRNARGHDKIQQQRKCGSVYTWRTCLKSKKNYIFFEVFKTLPNYKCFTKVVERKVWRRGVEKSSTRKSFPIRPTEI